MSTGLHDAKICQRSGNTWSLISRECDVPSSWLIKLLAASVPRAVEMLTITRTESRGKPAWRSAITDSLGHSHGLVPCRCRMMVTDS